MPPLPEVGLHHDLRRGGIWQHLPGVLGQPDAFELLVVGSLRFTHGDAPDGGSCVAGDEAFRLDEGDLALHAHVPLAFDGEAGKPVPGDLRHDVPGGDLLHGHVRKFQRRKMPAANLPFHKRNRAVLGDPVL